MGQVCQLQTENLNQNIKNNAYSIGQGNVPQDLKIAKKPRLSEKIILASSSLDQFKPKQMKYVRGQSATARIVNSDGTIYQGQWKDKLPHGMGEMFFPDGSYYIGFFFQGIPQGEGRLINEHGVIYQGQIQQGEAFGKGVLINNSKRYVYDGQWKNNVPHGNGKQNFMGELRSFYQGSFLNGLKNGYGTYKIFDVFEYKGNFLNNKIDGEGAIAFNNGQIYEGSFLDNKMHGNGVYKWPDTSSYQGSYRMGLKHGNGKFVSADGTVFEGNWIDGERQGNGVLKKIGQTKLQWRWSKDLPLSF